MRARQAEILQQLTEGVGGLLIVQASLLNHCTPLPTAPPLSRSLSLSLLMQRAESLLKAADFKPTAGASQDVGLGRERQNSTGFLVLSSQEFFFAVCVNNDLSSKENLPLMQPVWIQQLIIVSFKVFWREREKCVCVCVRASIALSVVCVFVNLFVCVCVCMCV